MGEGADEVHIRPAAQEDAPQLARIQVDSYQSAYRGILPDGYLAHFTYEEEEQDWRDLLAAPGGDVLLVAELATGELAGYALGRVEPSLGGRYDGELVALHVRQVDQRRGTGRALLSAIAGGLQRQGCTSMTLWVLAQNQARHFYERLVGQRTIELGEADVRAEEVGYGWMDLGSLATTSWVEGEE